MAVRLFIGNLPYGATEADLRAHFAAVAEPSHLVMPVDRETGRPRGFAFVEFAERPVAEEVIRKFDAQPFQGRNLAVSEARAREDRPPGPRPGGGGFGGGGFGGPGGRDRSANFGPPAPPKRLRNAKKQGQEHKVRGPIKEKNTGRTYALDDTEEGEIPDIDNVATKAADGVEAPDASVTPNTGDEGGEDQD